MSNLLERIQIERRTLGGAPWAPWLSPYFGARQSFAIGGPARPYAALHDQESVLSLAAVYASVSLLASSVAGLPIKVYRDTGDGQPQRVRNSSLLGSPIAGGGPQLAGTLHSWIYTGMTSCLLHGSAWGFITNRSGIASAAYPDGLPTGVAWLPGERISVQNDEMQPENPARARVYYQGRLVDQSELVHLPAFTVAGRLEGISPMRSFAMLFGQGLAELDFSRSFFENGGAPLAVMKNINEEVDKPQADEIRRRLTDTVKMRQSLVLGRDWDYSQIAIPQDESTFINSMKLNASQIAAVYSVPPWRVGGSRGDSMSYSNISSEQTDFVVNSLSPWLTRWEALLTSLLPSTQYASFDVTPLLRMDPQTQAQVRQIQRETGERSPNELRAEDDLGPLPGGDDAIPLAAVTRLAGSARAVPKSWAPMLEFESERTMAQLEQLASQGLAAAPPGPPVPASPASFAGTQLIAGRSRAEAIEVLERALAELRSRGELEAGTDE